ncbi:hypothetical protein LCGC14_3023040, partial [marine sediment metagenome]
MWQQIAIVVNQPVIVPAHVGPIFNQILSAPIDAGNITAESIHGELALSLGKLGIASKGVDTQFLADLAVEAAQLATDSVE